MITIVVPVRNEAENIAPLVAEISAAMAPLGAFEIIYVDDGSTDGTADALRHARASCPALRVVRHGAPCGQSRAIHTGVRRAHGDIIVTLDGDGQNDPADIPRLLAALDGSAGGEPIAMAHGRRAKRRDSAMRRVASRVASGARAMLLGDEIADAGCGIKAFRRDAYNGLPYFDHMHRFMPVLMRRDGHVVLSVDVNHRPREHGRSNYGIGGRLWVGIVDIIGVMWLQRRAARPTAVQEEEF